MTDKPHREVIEMPYDWEPLLVAAAKEAGLTRAAFGRSLYEAAFRSRGTKRLKLSAMRGRGQPKQK